MDHPHSSAHARRAAPTTPRLRRDASLSLARGFVITALTLVTACRSTGDPLDDAGGAPDPAVVALVAQAAIPLSDAGTDYDALMQIVGDARVVMLGEATHGTHEFYQERARITQRLIAEKGFSAVAIEGDWPDAYRVNQYVRGLGQDASAEQALSSFTQFPEWMWRNEDVRDLVRWMRTYNDARTASQRAGFYGLDVYSLYESADEVLAYLGRVDPAAAGRVRALYSCFGQWRPNAAAYGSATQRGTTCQTQAEQGLQEMTNRAAVRPADPIEAEALFSALRNAHTVVNAEAYFRTAYLGNMSTWNLRDQEMADALTALEDHLRTSAGREPKIVVWSHNTHTGDARVTQSGEAGEHNIGQLVRERHDGASLLVGFHTYTGRVLAASAWGETGRDQPIRAALPESYSGIFHATRISRFLLPLRNAGPHTAALSDPPRLQRAIGVVYAPNTERQSHYFTARLGQQFDAVVFIDTTRAVTPLR